MRTMNPTGTVYRGSDDATGMARVALDTGVPVINEVLAVFDPAQAVARAGEKVDRGVEAAHAAIWMANLLRRLPAPGRTSGKQ